MLRRLGAGEPIDGVCAAAGIARPAFDAWWRAGTAARAPALGGTRRVDGGWRAEIDRDASGVPHVYADSDEALFFGFGYAVAQDRLFQLDWLRRKAAGTLSEVLGRDGLES